MSHPCAAPFRAWKEWPVLVALASAPLAQSSNPLPHGKPVRLQRILHVPGESPTIQGAIERARDGDVVIVAPGTYRETLDFLGKAIEVLGTEGPTRTLVSPAGQGAAVHFHGGEGADSRLMGFTMRGSGDLEGSGGCVSCRGAGPVASPYLSDCIIERSGTDFLEGTGGAAGVDGNAILERCVLRQNNAFAFAGGAVEGSVTMLQCVVEDNWSCDGGGGLRLLPGSLVQDCLIQLNSTGPCGYHGEVYTSLGGGVLAPAGPVELVGCVLRANWVDEFPDPGDPGSCTGQNKGGGLHAGSGVTLRRCTIVGNQTLNCGLVGGIEGGPTLVDSIVYGNEDAPGFYGSRSSFRFSDVQGGAAGPGCIDSDPLFADATGGDLRLRNASPCIDAGDPASPLDPDGTRADLGAFHHPSAPLPLAVVWHEALPLRPEDPARARAFGSAVAIDGNTALVGAAALGYVGTEDSAHVFRREGGSWSEEARLAPSDPQAGDGFGGAVALQGDVAVVGAPEHQTLSKGSDGAVYVFERSAPDAPFSETVRLVPIGQERGRSFGASLALDSGFLVVGSSSLFEEGLVFVFQRLARGRWLQVARFTPPFCRCSTFGPSFGAAVAISGSTIVVGAPAFETIDQVPGLAFVYERAGATPYSWVQTNVLTPEGTRGRGNFGASVSIYGDALLVGSDFGAYAYERGGPGLPWSRATRIDPFEPTVVRVQGSHAWLSGASADVRELVQSSPGAPWTEVARFRAPFGSLAADRGSVLVGAPYEDFPVGEVHVFTRGVQVDSIASDQAADEEEVVLRGLELDTVTQVLVGGEEQPIVRQSARELVLRPARRDPGFADLELRSSRGSLTLPGAFESLPTLRVIPGDPGATSEVRLANGTSGAFVLFASFELRATPLPLANPPTWYGLWLDLVPGRSGKLLVDAFDSSGVAERRFAVPNIPALAGTPIYVQAWCRRGLFGPGRCSFTNLASMRL